MPDVVHSHIQMFVGDTKLYYELNNEQQGSHYNKTSQLLKTGQKHGD